jgi:hypothetical protein
MGIAEAASTLVSLHRIVAGLQPISSPPTAPPPSAPGFGVLAVPLIFGLVMLVVSIVMAIRTWRRGHKLLFVVGFFVPLAWFVGAFLPPPKDGAWI